MKFLIGRLYEILSDNLSDIDKFIKEMGSFLEAYQKAKGHLLFPMWLCGLSREYIQSPGFNCPSASRD
jgi:hypothetical protein